MLGASPLARAIVRGEDGPVAWLDRALPEPGRWLSRRVDPASGEGARHALRGLGGLVVVIEGGEPLHGLLVVSRAEVGVPVAIVSPIGVPLPEGVEGSGWARLAIGLPWGPGDPLHDRWAALGRLGRAVPVGDPGPVPVVPLGEVALLARALLAHPGAAWTWGGAPRTFPELAGALVRQVRPAWLRNRWAGPDAERVRRWVGRPGGPRLTPGWQPPAVAERARV